MNPDFLQEKLEHAKMKKGGDWGTTKKAQKFLL